MEVIYYGAITLIQNYVNFIDNEIYKLLVFLHSLFEEQEEDHNHW